MFFIVSIIGCSTSVNSNEPTTAAKIVESTPTEIIPNVSESIYTQEQNRVESAIKRSTEPEFELTAEDISKVKIDREVRKMEAISNALDKLTPRIIKEFRESIANLENHFSIENLVMASIKIKPLICLNFQGEDAKFFMDKVDLIRNPILLKSTVYSNVTSDGIKFIAIVQPVTSESNDFANIANKIRDSEEEMKLMAEMKEQGDSFAVDIYVEDLLAASDEINLSSIFLDKKYTYVKSPTTGDVNILAKYNRTISNSLKLKNKTWNLFLFQKTNSLPKEITIRYDVENVHLVQQFSALK